MYCLRILTGVKGISNGYLRAWINAGTGYTEVTNGLTFYNVNAIVVPETTCYPNQFSVQVQNTNNNGWIGNIERSIDGGITWAPMVCADQCTVPGGSTFDIVVDGNNDATGHDGCKNGALCTLTMFAGEPVSVCVYHHDIVVLLSVLNRNLKDGNGATSVSMLHSFTLNTLILLLLFLLLLLFGVFITTLLNAYF